MIKKTGSRGFTLIELLVVIAIIGILASVVLASLNTARGRGSDAAIKANLSNARAQAELFYESGVPTPTYTAVCTSTNANSILQLMRGAANQAGIPGATPTIGTALTLGANGSANTMCRSDETRWIAASTLRTNPARAFCVDNTGAAREIGTAIAATVWTCPAS